MAKVMIHSQTLLFLFFLSKKNTSVKIHLDITFLFLFSNKMLKLRIGSKKKHLVRIANWEDPEQAASTSEAT